MTDSIDLENSSSHSLNCGSDYKDVYCVQSVAKLNRSELEDLYYQLHNENIEIKKKFNNLDSKYKIMATRVMRLSRDHKCIDSVSREEDQRELQLLRQSETALRAKLAVLRGQLASHTRLHSAALSKMQRPRSHRCSRSCCNRGCGGDDESILEVSRSGSHSQGQIRHRSLSQGGGSQHGNRSQQGISHVLKSHRDLAEANGDLQEEISHLKEKIRILQEDILHSGELSQTRIQELEAELGKHLAQETTENVELIKARRIIKHQEAAIISHQQEHQISQRELQACKAALSLAAKDQDELCLTLMRERQRSTDLQQEIVKLSQNCSSIRDIEEQLNDAKKENAVLKEHSNRLLQLTTNISDAVNSPMSTLQNQQGKISNQDFSKILEENSIGEQKLESLKQQQSHLQQNLQKIHDEISALHQKILDANEERNNLKDEHMRVQNECSKFRFELTEPSEERKRLAHELEEVRNECTRLAEEISKSRTELAQQESLHQVSQDRTSSLLLQEKSEFDRSGSQQLPFLQAPAPSRPSFYTPQLSARINQFLSPPQSSHPCTPRPRVGDACLALLEQTAIRPPSSSFPGVLGSHSSLQERFLELCIPVNSDPSTTKENGENLPKAAPNVAVSTPADILQGLTQQTERSPKSRMTNYQQITGQTDTQRELDKCRELLRVQFNLNSIYKKEVASLNNIVQSLTSGNQDTSKHKCV